jgi:hypothetical protein
MKRNTKIYVRRLLLFLVAAVVLYVVLIQPPREVPHEPAAHSSAHYDAEVQSTSTRHVRPTRPGVVVTEAPTEAPTAAVTEAPTAPATEAPTEAPTAAVTEEPTAPATEAPTEAPTAAATEAPTAAATEAPTEAPTAAATEAPTAAATEAPTDAPTAAVTEAPTVAPTSVTEAPEQSPPQLSVNVESADAQTVEWNRPPINLTWEEAPLPAHLMPAVPFPASAVAFMEEHLRAGDFSLMKHGQHLFDLLAPHVKRAVIGDVLEEFEAPRELLELPVGANTLDPKPASPDDHLQIQAAFDMIKRLNATAHEHWRDPPSGFVPSMGLVCMRNDFYLLLQYIIRLETVPLGRLVLVVNGRSAVIASMFVDIVRRSFPAFVTGYPLRRNEGLAYAWNAIIRATFALPPPPELLATLQQSSGGGRSPIDLVRAATEFVWISNVDLIYEPGVLASAASNAHKQIQSRRELIRKFQTAHERDLGAPQPVRLIRAYGFAAFLYCNTALPVLGYFDESLFPAYGEDIEFLCRLRSLGDQVDALYAVTKHVGSVAVARDSRLREMVDRFPRWPYITAKWNITPKTEYTMSDGHIFKHPFNDPRIPLTSWYVDPRQRACVRYGKAGSKCNSNESDTVNHIVALRGL